MKLMDFLEKVSADYEVIEHRPTFTSQELAAEEEAAAEFEIQELFDDIGAAGMDDFGDDAAPAPAAEATSDDEEA